MFLCFGFFVGVEAGVAVQGGKMPGKVTGNSPVSPGSAPKAWGWVIVGSYFFLALIFPVNKVNEQQFSKLPKFFYDLKLRGPMPFPPVMD